MIVIGLTGTLGAGKGTVVDFLKNEYGFSHYSVRGFLLREIAKLGLEGNRDTMVKVANSLREKHGPSYITDQLYEEATRNGTPAVIESIRTPGEIDSLRRKSDFILWAVDADPEIRYQRILKRGSETDHISYETFLQNEQREMEGKEPFQQNLKACIGMADHLFYNNGTIDELYHQVREAVEELPGITAKQTGL
ncbi:MAG: AAA family ATPase [Bacteroidales bacterium]